MRYGVGDRIVRCGSALIVLNNFVDLKALVRVKCNRVKLGLSS